MRNTIVLFIVLAACGRKEAAVSQKPMTVAELPSQETVTNAAHNMRRERQTPTATAPTGTPEAAEPVVQSSPIEMGAGRSETASVASQAFPRVTVAPQRLHANPRGTGVTTEAAAGRRPAVAHPAALAGVPGRREGMAVPVMYPLDKFRVNLMLVTLPVPASTWGELRAVTPGMTGGTFQVKLWRLRKSIAERMQALDVPNGPVQMVQYPLRSDLFRMGDVAIIEYHPALFPPAMQASVIDNASGDPARFPFTMTGFKEGVQ